MAASDKPADESLYPIAVLIDELKNEDIQVSAFFRSALLKQMPEMKKMAIKCSWSIPYTSLFSEARFYFFVRFVMNIKIQLKCVLCMRNKRFEVYSPYSSIGQGFVDELFFF